MYNSVLDNKELFAVTDNLFDRPIVLNLIQRGQSIGNDRYLQTLVEVLLSEIFTSLGALGVEQSCSALQKLSDLVSKFRKHCVDLGISKLARKFILIEYQLSREIVGPKKHVDTWVQEIFELLEETRAGLDNLDRALKQTV